MSGWGAKTPAARAEAPVSKAGASKADDVSAFLAKVQAMPPVAKSGGRGRLVFAMDATMSRQPTWDRALAIQAEMFQETRKAGGLDVQLVYFRGFNECRASKWVGDAGALARVMAKVDCRGGNTQIARVLSHIKTESKAGKIDAAVYVGDAMEENIDALCKAAGEAGLLGVPLFMFQEGEDGNTARAFKEMARLSRGAYFKLDSASAKMLGELLSAVAVYAAGGRKALAASRGRGAALLLEKLS
jgi:hypothetical protein